ncbi:MAG: glycosyl hydrolase 115 family protein [Anaerobacillus sp.]|uniref:glycosyl hydrolase 115 family protein n=1 Tax=Anaerobacillus sp. TaxID=1872506 RepID=UPI003918A9F6
MNSFVLTRYSTILIPEHRSKPVQHALDMLIRDMTKVFGSKPNINTSIQTPDIIIRYKRTKEQLAELPESFSIRFKKDHSHTSLQVIGHDDLGVIYGILHISTKYLGVDPFWYWADIKVLKNEEIVIPIRDYDSPKAKVRYRGWFVNDEVCLIGWKDEYPPTKEVWFPVFEALLRCGGNMCIPGTDLPRNGVHFDLASDMGLWVTHHHAEPLGAEMFLRAFPDKKASYLENAVLYEKLWDEAIQKQKDKKVVWVLSFRGQGDQPFWDHDPGFDTPQKRGKLISDVVKRQLEMITQYVVNPVCCVALYGEISELYRSGHIEIPNGVIKVWADNGYGKMVSRRNGNENYRISSLPEKADKGKQGIYYHVTFHDLQASNHLTMFPSPPTLIKEEIDAVFENGGDDYLLLNSGNIRMHLYSLDIIKELWNNGTIEVAGHIEQFIHRLYSSNQGEIANLYKNYFECTIKYGENHDDRAGDEFYHHPARKIIGHWIQGKTNESLIKLEWATGKVPFLHQIKWFKAKCEEALEKWSQLKDDCIKICSLLNEEDRIRLIDQLLVQVELHYSGCKGFISLCNAYLKSKENQYPIAFVYASQAIWDYQEGLQAMSKSEHGKWKNFYRADWLTNVKWTIESLVTLRKYLRMQGDSPDFFLWYKEFVMPESEKHIYLENTHRNPLSDDELACILKEKFF